MTTLTVALCTYQGAVYLDALLASVAAQTRRPDELVVLDDGSTDGTVELVEAKARSLPFPVRVQRNEERLGVVGNFTRALEASAGDLVAFADQDDVWLAEKLDVLERAMAEEGAAAAFGDAWITDASGVRTGRRHWDAIGFGARERARYDADPLGALLRRNPVTGAAMVVDRADALALLPMSAAGLHDQWISLLLVARGRRVVAVDEPLVDYRSHGANQVGAPAPTRRARLQARQRAGPHAPHGDELAFFEDAARAADRIGVATDIAARLDAKVAHLRHRAGLPESYMRRVAPCVAELARGRYHRYSRGLDSFAFDLVFR